MFFVYVKWIRDGKFSFLTEKITQRNSLPSQWILCSVLFDSMSHQWPNQLCHGFSTCVTHSQHHNWHKNVWVNGNFTFKNFFWGYYWLQEKCYVRVVINTFNEMTRNENPIKLVQSSSEIFAFLYLFEITLGWRNSPYFSSYQIFNTSRNLSDIAF